LRPKDDNNFHSASFPLRIPSAVEEMGRGDTVTCHKEVLPGKYITAAIWRDNKVIRFLSTAFFDSVEDIAQETVNRWSRAYNDNIQVAVRRFIKEYVKHMGYVDMRDRQLQQLNIRMKRCKKQIKKKSVNFGLIHFLSLKLSIGLAKLGHDILFKEKFDSAVEAFHSKLHAESVKEKVGKRNRTQRTPVKKTPNRRPRKIKREKNSAVKVRRFKLTDSKMISAINKMKKKKTRRASGKFAATIVSPPSVKPHLPNGHCIPKPLLCCDICKVRLCRGCFHKWDHIQRIPKQN